MTERDQLTGWLNNNLDAVALIEMIFSVSQIADDFVDGDKPINKTQAMCEMLTIAMVQIPANPVFNQFRGWIAPVLVNAFNAWGASNVWHKSSNADIQMLGWAWRDMGETLINSLAFVLSGQERALQVAIEVGEYYRTNEDKENLEQWKVSI